MLELREENPNLKNIPTQTNYRGNVKLYTFNLIIGSQRLTIKNM